MDVYTNSIQHLSVAEKLQLVERIWDDVANASENLPLPEWVIQEARRRREELIANPEIGITHEAMWDKLRKAPNA